MADGLCQLFVLLELADDVNSTVDEALAPWGLSRATFEALFRLHQMGAQTQRALADRAKCAPSNITRLIDRLEGQGYVSRGKDPDDRRVVQAHVTDAGQAALREASEAMAGVQERLLARLRDADGRCAGDKP
jgi:DNA-binding MarR family transcriptional regulator